MTSTRQSTSAETFVGFGFGAIQAGLYLYEAQEATRRSGAFGRLVVAYRRPEVIAQVREARGYVSLNIAQPDGIETLKVGPVEMFDVNVAAERESITEAISEASEVAVAVSSVSDYVSRGEGSLHLLLALGLERKGVTDGPGAVIYASENHTRAAQILRSSILEALPEDKQERVLQQSCFVNTVIGKMSRTVQGLEEIGALGLEPITPKSDRAFLVERYRDILISSVTFPDHVPFGRGLASFTEKDDLTPFEEAKLYGHNAAHALAAYLGVTVGVTYIAELNDVPGFFPFLRAAALGESGAALIRRHSGADPMFTKRGYEDFMEELLKRMLNPYLKDTVARVGRDAPRKLGWDDRLVGTVRLVLREGLQPHRHALGVAAALKTIDSSPDMLPNLWKNDRPDKNEQRAVLDAVARGAQHLEAWQNAGRPALEPFVQSHSGEKR